MWSKLSIPGSGKTLLQSRMLVLPSLHLAFKCENAGACNFRYDILFCFCIDTMTSEDVRQDNTAEGDWCNVLK
jgi:hypothetical protein